MTTPSVRHQPAQCQHDACHCDVPKERAARGDSYCSDECARQQQPGTHMVAQCDCGHPTCGGR